MRELTAEDLEISPALIELAKQWPYHIGSSERNPSRFSPDGPTTVTVHRCSDCDEEIWPMDASGRLRHLMLTHGYRMDGRQFDNKNKEIGHA